MSQMKSSILINPNYATNNVDTQQAGWYQISPNSSNLALRVINSNIGLSGEIRPVANGHARLNDAAKHGFKKAVIPKANVPKTAIKGLEILGVSTLSEALVILADL